MSNREHIAQAAAMASAAYPNWNPTRATFEAWAVLLPDLDPDEFLAAMVGHIRHSKFPPTVADILERARSLRPPAHGESIAAWGEVHKAIRSSSQPAGGWSDELTRPALDMLGGWSRVLGCQTSEIVSLRSKFCQAWDSLAADEARTMEGGAVATISRGRDLIAGVADKLALGGN